jgi:predicted heme/steroid binding protein
MTMRRFNRVELSAYNGKDGAPVYIAFEGKVYDVSESLMWRGGYHWIYHCAGEDLTEQLKDAPHGKEFIQRFPIVGEYNQTFTPLE